jgi:hypothetical protein
MLFHVYFMYKSLHIYHNKNTSNRCYRNKENRVSYFQMKQKEVDKPKVLYLHFLTLLEKKSYFLYN